MIRQHSPHDIHVHPCTLSVTCSWRWRNRKNHIRQGIVPVELSPCTLDQALILLFFLFKRHLTGEFEKKYIGMYRSFILDAQRILSRRVPFCCYLRVTPIAQPPLELRFTL